LNPRCGRPKIAAGKVMEPCGAIYPNRIGS
jgi:hypothetical protein